MEPIIVVTNNPMSRAEFKEKNTVEFIGGSTMEVYKRTRDLIHEGHRLLTHPLMSSIKPNETPYRTVLVTKKSFPELDLQSIQYIEEAIHATEKFLKDFGVPAWTEKVLEDFQLIDYDLISHAIS
ncbi:MAG: GrdX family protein [Clostridiaceae bacterium]